MKKIIINFLLILVSIMLFIFLSFVGVYAIFTEKIESNPNNILNAAILIIWFIVFILIIYFIIKFLISIYRYKE